MSDERGRLASPPALVPGGPAGEPPPEDPVEPRTEPRPQPSQPERESVEGLAAFVVEQAGRPVDVWAIAALLESAGIRDRDAVSRYGRRDVFGLARAVQVRLPEQFAVAAIEAPAPEAFPARLRRSARLFGRGTFFFLPLLLQVVALLAFDISQYAYIAFTTYEASLVAAGVGLAFVVSGGFIQALGYLGPVFEEPGKHMLTRRVVATVLLAGVAMGAVVGLALWGLSALTDAYPADGMRTVLAYYGLTAIQSLLNAVLYMLRRYLLMLVTTIGGLAFVIVLYRTTDWQIERLHWVGLGFLILFQLAVVLTLMARRAAGTRGPMRLAHLPRARLLVRRAGPFWLYGSLYFALLLADRVVAWADGAHPLPLWFHTSYELGLDWALLGVVVALAFLEVVVEDFSRLLYPATERYRADALRDLNRAVRRFWLRRLATVAALAALGAWVAIGLAWLLNRVGALGPAAELYGDRATHIVFAGGILGYALLAVAIGNTVFLMSLARPTRVLVGLLPGLATSLAVGILLTSTGAYYNAVWGLVAGAGVFAVVTAVEAGRALRRADFHSYAAF